MDIIIFVFVGGICFSQGYNAYNCEKQTHVFNKRNLPLKDVKEYNHFCGKLIYGFTVAALLTFVLMWSIPTWGGLIGTVLLIVEAFVLVKIYAKNELKYIRQN